MSSGRKYVRAPEFQTDSEESDGYLLSESEYAEPEKEQYGSEHDDDKSNTGNDTCVDEQEEREESNLELRAEKRLEAGNPGNSCNVRRIGTESENQTGNTTLSTAHNANQVYCQRMEQIENTLNQLLRAMNSSQPINGSNPAPSEVDHSWTLGNVVTEPTLNAASVRWQNIQPFPDDVPANKMWEQWHRFIDRFEIAISLSNINDPVKRAQILFLSMGEKLQGIARAARLRPSLQEPNCYAVFVRNVESYLRSMVDITAEHEAFSNLKQGPDEPAIAFHARLMEKVRLCGYSSVDQDRFVRAQLLKGMRNKELVKASRTFGYETTFIVQSATREEAYAAETAQPESSQAFVIARNRHRNSNEQQWKRKYERTSDGWSQRKKRDANDSEYRGTGRRSRCSKCNKLFHKFGSCPAVNSKCNTCGQRGHFAVVCRKKVANSVHVTPSDSPGWAIEEEKEKKVNE